ncbi:hypothetical protein BC332_22857 [Capsicum chinense]|nr:hypothetical protein BC332_22857 [Capsicum chinense]
MSVYSFIDTSLPLRKSFQDGTGWCFLDIGDGTQMAYGYPRQGYPQFMSMQTQMVARGYLLHGRLSSVHVDADTDDGAWLSSVHVNADTDGTWLSSARLSSVHVDADTDYGALLSSGRLSSVHVDADTDGAWLSSTRLSSVHIDADTNGAWLSSAQLSAVHVDADTDVHVMVILCTVILSSSRKMVHDYPQFISTQTRMVQDYPQFMSTQTQMVHGYPLHGYPSVYVIRY